MSQFFPPGPPPGEPGPDGDEPPAPQRNRVPVVITVAAALLVVALVLALAVAVAVVVQRVLVHREQQASAGANLDDVQVFEGLRNDHTEGDVDYDTVPPAGGPHDPVWLQCGAYDEPVRDENAVHDLEHGAVWITYDPDLSGDDVDALAKALPDNGILSPYDDLPSPVVVTVWERQLELTGADDPRLALFFAGFSDGHTAPEPFASCAGGASEPDGGNSTDV